MILFGILASWNQGSPAVKVGCFDGYKMYSTYRLQADELSDDFITALKKTYQHRQIEIIVQEVQDETDYLMSTPANREHLLQAIENINNHTNLVTVNLEDL